MFYGRESQIEQLDALWGKRVSSLVTCRGRRRVGKSTLVEEFAKRSKARFVKIEGLRPTSKTTLQKLAAGAIGDEPARPGSSVTACDFAFRCMYF